MGNSCGIYLSIYLSQSVYINIYVYMYIYIYIYIYKEREREESRKLFKLRLYKRILINIQVCSMHD